MTSHKGQSLMMQETSLCLMLSNSSCTTPSVDRYIKKLCVMTPGSAVNVHLVRINGQVPWGFRMAGGLDFRTPLIIQRVTPGTIAANCGVFPGDIILQINGIQTGMLKHKDAQQIIMAAGNSLSLCLHRDSQMTAVAPVFGDNHTTKYVPSTPYVPNPKAAPATPGHGDAYVAPGYAYQAPDPSFQVPGYAPELKDLPTSASFQTKTIPTSSGVRMVYSGSILNPQAVANQKPAPLSPPPPLPTAMQTRYVTSPPQAAPTPFQAVPKPSQQTAPTLLQHAPKPWVPSDDKNKVSNLQCGDSVAHRGYSTYYESAPLDPSKIPVCSSCHINIRGPFIVALNKCWCPKHFSCDKCSCELVNVGFIELNGKVYCEKDYEVHFAPRCAKCSTAIVGDTVNALKKTWHKSCFLCTECNAPISTGAFQVEDGKPYCMKDWQRMFQTKCAGCEFPVEPGDRWIEALDQNWHSECFACKVCNIPLEGKQFFARDSRPYCKGHAGAAAR